MTARTWTLTITAPAAWVNANGRRSARQLAPTIRLWRNAGHTYARQAKLPKLERAHILAMFHFNDRRHRDANNWSPTAKALVDGIVGDYGLLVNDSSAYLDGPDCRIGEPIVKGRKRTYAPPGQVVLTITEVS